MIIRVSRPPVNETPIVRSSSKYDGKIRLKTLPRASANASAESVGWDSQAAGMKYRRLWQRRSGVKAHRDAPGRIPTSRKSLFQLSVQQYYRNSSSPSFYSD